MAKHVKEVLLDAAVEVAIQGLIKKGISTAKTKAFSFRKTLERLELTIKLVSPIMDDIVKSEKTPTDAYRKFAVELKRATALVDRYSGMKKCKLVQTWKVQKEIKELDRSLQNFLNIELQAEQSRKMSEISNAIVELNKKVDQLIVPSPGQDDATRANESKPEIASKESSSDPGTANDHEGSPANDG